jgi:hypothetical protein
VFVHDFTDVEVGLERVVDLLVGVSGEFSVWAQAAYRRGEALALGPGSGRLSPPISLKVGEPLRGFEVVTIPITWTAAAATALFPRMDADIVASAVGPHTTHLEFRGTYQPPLNGFGAMLDRIAFHRVAEATVRSFMTRLTEALNAEASVFRRQRLSPGAGR